MCETCRGKNSGRHIFTVIFFPHLKKKKILELRQNVAKKNVHVWFQATVKKYSKKFFWFDVCKRKIIIFFSDY